MLLIAYGVSFLIKNENGFIPQGFKSIKSMLQELLQEYKWRKQIKKIKKNKIRKSLESISENLPFDIKIKEDVIPKWIKKNLPNIGMGFNWLSNLSLRNRKQDQHDHKNDHENEYEYEYNYKKLIKELSSKEKSNEDEFILNKSDLEGLLIDDDDDNEDDN